MKRVLLAIFVLITSAGAITAQNPQTPFEGNTKTSATYDEAIAFYKELEKASPMVKVIPYKNGTDVGKPLHLVVISKNNTFHPVPLRQADKRIVLINNGIHPGEPCGVDASMILARDLATDKIYGPMLEHIVVCIIPVYNVGGALNRSSYSRANQNGPEAYGFRGNARNLDLNRDFIKADSRNARTFNKIFVEWKPDFLIDTHTSNGADYQYTMTYIPTQKDKFEPSLAQYMTEILNKELSQKMISTSYEMSPYVQTLGWGMTPDSGIVGFLETPRYSTGYGALFNTIGYTTEAHMLKPFEDRVYGTYHFCLNLLKIINRDRKIIGRMRKEALSKVKKQETFTLRWELDKTVSEEILFKGYTASKNPSGITGFPRLSYDRDAPWSRNIPWYNTYKPTITVQKPVAYVIPQAWAEVIERFKLNGVKMKQLREDSEIDVAVYYIDNFKVSPRPYEGHYPIGDVKLRKENQKLRYFAGDYVVFVDQATNRYIVETLEPEAHDSFFHWNFFDEILMRKEYFSSYVFEKSAQELLQVEPKIKEELQEKIKQDSVFAKSDWAQMDFIYKRSKYYEPTHLRYPIARMEKNTKLNFRK
ncbi:MAG: M14 family metallopeptidase [Bacteroidota bacterium]